MNRSRQAGFRIRKDKMKGETGLRPDETMDVLERLSEYGYNSESIYRELKKDILDLTLKPGETCSENQLCARFSVSRTPIRTALQRLQAEGLMRVIPYKGSVVTLLDFDEIRQNIYMRTAIESAVLRDFLPLCTPLLEEKIRYQIRKQSVLITESFLPQQFYNMDSAMHEIWFRVTGKMLLWQMIQKAQTGYTRFRMLDIVEERNFMEIIEEHEALFGLIRHKNTAGIEPLMKKHLNGGINRLGKRMETEFADYFMKTDET